MLLTWAPFLGLYREVIKVVGPLYLRIGEAVLESACLNVASWMYPMAPTLLDLPLLGSVLRSNFSNDLISTEQVRIGYLNIFLINTFLKLPTFRLEMRLPR